MLSNNGDVVIFWSEKTEDDFKQRYKLYVERINADNKRVWKNSPLQSYSYSTQNARLLSLGEKGYAVVWDDTLIPSKSDESSSFVRKRIYLQGISEDGKLLKSKPVKILDSKGLYGETIYTLLVMQMEVCLLAGQIQDVHFQNLLLKIIKIFKILKTC